MCLHSTSATSSAIGWVNSWCLTCKMEHDHEALVLWRRAVPWRCWWASWKGGSWCTAGRWGPRWRPCTCTDKNRQQGTVMSSDAGAKPPPPVHASWCALPMTGQSQRARLRACQRSLPAAEAGHPARRCLLSDYRVTSAPRLIWLRANTKGNWNHLYTGAVV